MGGLVQAGCRRVGARAAAAVQVVVGRQIIIFIAILRLAIRKFKGVLIDEF